MAARQLVKYCMKRILALLLFFSVLAQADEPVVIDKKVVCNWTKPLLENLAKKHGEEPVWLGQGNEQGRYTLFVNPNTGAWTLVQFNREVACVIGAGESHQVITPRSTM